MSDVFTLKDMKELERKLFKAKVKPVYMASPLNVTYRLMKYAKINRFKIFWNLFLLRLFGRIKVGGVNIRRIR